MSVLHALFAGLIHNYNVILLKRRERILLEFAKYFMTKVTIHTLLIDYTELCCCITGGAGL